MAGFSLQLKNVAQWVTLVASTVIVLGGVATFVALTQSYFVRQQDMLSIQQDMIINLCTNEFETELLALQMGAGNAYARYLNTKINLLELREKSHDSSEQAKERIIAEDKLERLWEDVNKLHDKASELVEKFGEEAEKCTRDAEALVRSAS